MLALSQAPRNSQGGDLLFFLRQLNRGNPDITLIINDHAFTETVGFVEGAGQYGPAPHLCPGFGHVGIAAVNAKLNTNAARVNTLHNS